MQIVQAARASAILYSLLSSRGDVRPWLLPANICPVVPLVFRKAGVPFDFADISPSSLHMDLDLADERLQPGLFGGLLYAHSYGEPSTPEAFFQRLKARDPRLFIIDDRCLCSPDLDPLDTYADVALYSTGYAKQVDLGGGGYAFVKSSVRYVAASLAFEPARYEELEVSYKLAIRERRPLVYHDSAWLQTVGPLSAWSAYQARVATARELASGLRERIVSIYTQALPAEIQLPAAYQCWRFNLRVPNRAELLEAIFAAGQFASAHYASLAGIMAPGDCPNAEGLASQVVNLFCDRYFTPERAERVSAVILAHMR
ncbi:MAG TPA: hypothetical protein VJN18_20590 [Polyangiaceae bacterium]|nr:hypothetical protein [Polyangiaceae bacterium]